LINKYWILFFGLIFLLACKKESFQEPQNFGYNYQVRDLGYWIDYQVDSIVFSDITNPASIDTYSYFIRESIESEFEDASGNSNLRVEVYKKYELSDAWSINQAATFTFKEDNFQRNFQDLRFISLIFPVREGREWQGNVFIDVLNEPSLEFLDDDKYNWTYRYTEVDIPKLMGSFSFDSCATVIQIDEENLFEKKYSMEVYARNVGLIQKSLIILNTQAPPSGVSFFERAESGFILNYTLIDYKN
jgi:hypothetical protein